MTTPPTDPESVTYSMERVTRSVQPPERLDGTRTYHLEGLIGAGSLAHIYRARCEQDGCSRAVALKVLMKPRFTAQLWEEARILGLMTHHAIPRIEGRLFVHGYPALVMEYIPSVSLGFLLGEHGQLPAGIALEIVARIASALTELHDHIDENDQTAPIVHGDVKPENIVLTPSGGVKLIDFGSARPPAINLKEIYGTREYLAPEGFQRCVRTASDVYSLGVVLCELLTGRAPHSICECRFVKTSVHKQVREFFDESDLRHSEALSKLVIQLLGDERGQRPSAEEAEDACRHLLMRMSSPALSPWARRHVRPPHPRRLAPFTGVTVRAPGPLTWIQQGQRWYQSFIARLFPPLGGGR